MRRNRFTLIVVVLGLVVVLLVAATVQAQTGGGYDLSWYSIDGGGAMLSTGGSYSLSGTIGQPDAGALSGGGYTLNGGFWGGGTTNYAVYLPLVLK